MPIIEFGAQPMAKTQAKDPPKRGARQSDTLMVASVEKGFRVLNVFGPGRQELSLSQIADLTGLDVSGAQRFTHTLLALGYLNKDPGTRRLSLTPKTLDLASHFLGGHRLVNNAMPYLMHLSKETEETVNLTLLDDTEIIFVARFMSRHMLNTDVVIGTRMPAYCTAPGIAILSRLPEDEAVAIIDRSKLIAYTEHTTVKRAALIDKIRLSAKQGYATQFEEFYLGDASIAAAVVDANGRPQGAVNLAVSRSRFTPDEMVQRFGALVVAAAHTMSPA
jgi:DNA-binding IclR family transcriptional regulator